MIPEPHWWSLHYSNVPPIGHQLRRAFPDRWLRIHSLPEMQRYPQDDQDWAMLRQRHRQACEALFQPGRHCYLATLELDAPSPWFANFALSPASHLPGYLPDIANAPPVPFHTAEFLWDFEAFLPVLEAVSFDESSASVFAADGSAAYCPYDGGADLILPTSAQRDRLKESLADIISPLDSGL